MSKQIVKQELDKLIAEAAAAVSGEKVTKRAQNVSKTQNKAYYKDVEGKMKDYDKNLKQEDENSINPKKNNYEGSEKEYHDQMEIRNGQEMIQYDREPSEQFKDRAKKSLEGDSTMGNKTYTGKENGNTEEVWGASGGKHIGKEIVKAAKASAKKRAEGTPQFNSFGDDIENKPKGTNVPVKKIATEGMKRIKFKKPFNGVGNALKLIPEAFRVDNKQFEMTDGSESYKIKWQGSLTEGRAIVLEANSSDLMNEGFAKIKHLMGYKSENTLGTPTANERINENNRIKTGISQGFTNKIEEIDENCEEIEGQVAPTVTKDNVPHANAEGDMVMAESDDNDEDDSKEKPNKKPSEGPRPEDWEQRYFGSNG